MEVNSSMFGKSKKSLTIANNMRIISSFAFNTRKIGSIIFDQANALNKIDEFAFWRCPKLKIIVFPPRLEEIGQGSFSCCEKLISVSFMSGSQLHIISRMAFQGCSNLTSFVFPSLLTTIGEYAFLGCENLANIDLSGTHISFIGKKAFDIDIKLVKLPANKINFNNINPNNGNKIIKYYASKANISSENATTFIHNGVKQIISNSFNNSNISTINIPASVERICKSAFIYSNVKTVSFHPNSHLIIIEKKAFYSCHKLKSISFPKSLKVIEEDAFYNSGLVEARFPKNSQLEEIYPFNDTQIKSLHLPPSLMKINYACEDMGELTEILVSNDLFQSNRENTAIFSKDGSELISVINSLTKFTIPPGVKVIKRAFSFSKIKEELLIPASVEIIEDNAFKNSKLNIRFEEGTKIRSIGFHSFGKLDSLVINNEHFTTNENGVIMSINPKGIVFVPKSLENLNIDQDIEVVYSNAFYQSKIDVLNFPPTLKRIYSDAFSSSEIKEINFAEGTELDFFEKNHRMLPNLQKLILPPIKDFFCFGSLFCESIKVLMFPSNFAPKEVKFDEANEFYIRKIYVPKSSMKSVALLGISAEMDIIIIEG